MYPRGANKYRWFDIDHRLNENHRWIMMDACFAKYDQLYLLVLTRIKNDIRRIDYSPLSLLLRNNEFYSGFFAMMKNLKNFLLRFIRSLQFYFIKRTHWKSLKIMKEFHFWFQFILASCHNWTTLKSNTLASVQHLHEFHQFNSATLFIEN